MEKGVERSLQEVVVSMRERIGHLNRLANGRSYWGCKPGYYDDVDEVYYHVVLLLEDIRVLKARLLAMGVIE